MVGMACREVDYWLIDIPIGRGVIVGIKALCSEKTIGYREKENLGHDHTRD
jgi:hypothetical protein